MGNAIATRGLVGRLTEEIGSAIVDGTFPAGERLDLELIERRHDVSRTVVREALRVLATKGVIEARPKRGTIVLAPERWNMLDPEMLAWRLRRPDAGWLASLDEVRQIVEPAAARIAARRRTGDDLRGLSLVRTVATRDVVHLKFAKSTS